MFEKPSGTIKPIRPVTLKQGTVTISEKEYQRLLDSDRFLECLEAVGVDSWDNYNDACDLYNGE